jgi:hypothetical protein
MGKARQTKEEMLWGIDPGEEEDGITNSRRASPNLGTYAGDRGEGDQ